MPVMMLPVALIESSENVGTILNLTLVQISGFVEQTALETSGENMRDNTGGGGRRRRGLKIQGKSKEETRQGRRERLL